MPVPFREVLLSRGIELVEVAEPEFETLGCNVLAVAPRDVLMVAGNRETRARLERAGVRSEEHMSELQSRLHLVCRLLLEKKIDEHDAKFVEGVHYHADVWVTSSSYSVPIDTVTFALVDVGVPGIAVAGIVPEDRLLHAPS